MVYGKETAFCCGIAWVLVDQMVHHLQIKEGFASSASLVCHLPPSFVMPALLTVASELLSTVWFKKKPKKTTLWSVSFDLIFFPLSTLIVFEYIFTGFLQFCGFGCNSIYKSCYKKLLCKLYPSFISHLCGSVPEPSHAVTQLLGADALCQSFIAMGLWD